MPHTPIPLQIQLACLDGHTSPPPMPPQARLIHKRNLTALPPQCRLFRLHHSRIAVAPSFLPGEDAERYAQEEGED